MTTKEASERAAKLGLSAWMVQVSPAGGKPSESSSMKCVGFGDLELPLGEGDTWDEAFRRATRLIFGAR